MSERRNTNRSYMKLIVWQDAKAYYVFTCGAFRPFPSIDRESAGEAANGRLAGQFRGSRIEHGLRDR